MPNLTAINLCTRSYGRGCWKVEREWGGNGRITTTPSTSARKRKVHKPTIPSTYEMMGLCPRKAFLLHGHLI